MTTYNRILGNQALTQYSAASVDDGRQSIGVEVVIDFGAAGNAHAAGDVFSLMNVPAGYAVELTGAEVLQADTAGNSGTVQLKVGAAAQGSAVAPSSLGFLGTVGTGTVVVPSGSNATLNVTVATGAINAIVRFFIRMLDCRMKLGTGVVIGATTNPAGQTVANVVSPTVAYTFETATVPVP